MWREYLGGDLYSVSVREPSDLDPAWQIAAMGEVWCWAYNPYVEQILFTAAGLNPSIPCGLYQLRLLSVGALSSKELTTYAELIEQGLSCGWQLCPAALAPLFLLQHRWLWHGQAGIAMRAVVIDGEDRYLCLESDTRYPTYLAAGVSSSRAFLMDDYHLLFLEKRP